MQCVRTPPTARADRGSFRRILGVSSCRTHKARAPAFSTHLPRTAVGRADRGCCTGGGRALQSHQGHGGWAAALEGSGGEETGGEEDVGRCAAEIVSVTGEKMPSQTLIQQRPEPRRCSRSVLLRASSAVTGVLMSGKS
ncbi:hypothetical protein CesoFtcFv8_024322 [Champsocephalus esox]|uniref:Uncharacterized protein n=1 Tax=Champsocephalus esox TaxID=159716 RepID=A0AAN8B5I3_9TELE|nr:hypothetical protein CesoFtcFv8_024322 [Champsocephalus esox]